ncbi:MAG: GNAT family N-acetyltransferase [Chloroflexi bacterium]|jgi:ribosomal protein S18 acetylase RimI-like enzyme|nr:GNAT family N-acetyltransferase [Chloroflexota bacterium]
MGMGSQVEIRRGLPDEYRRQAAEILYDGFRRKYQAIFGSEAHGVAIMEKDLDPDNILIALRQGELVGLTGVEYGRGRYMRPRMATLAVEYGWLRSRLMMAASVLFFSPHRKGELHLGPIAVKAGLRGQGIGTRLLEASFDLARREGLHAVRLEVVDTNPDARRLYERLGFRAIKVKHYPFVRNWMGLSAAITMIKEIE